MKGMELALEHGITYSGSWMLASSPQELASQVLGDCLAPGCPPCGAAQGSPET